MKNPSSLIPRRRISKGGGRGGGEKSRGRVRASRVEVENRMQQLWLQLFRLNLFSWVEEKFGEKLVGAKKGCMCNTGVS